MQILILDPDLAIQDFYRNLLEAEFRSVETAFASSSVAVLERLKTDPPDLLVTEGRADGMEFLDFLQLVVDAGVPVIVASTDGAERFIVECLRVGALDFISKRRIKMGLFPSIVRRALLEADRASRIQKLAAEHPHRPEFVKVNLAIRKSLEEEKAEQQRRKLARGVFTTTDESDLVEGKSYYIVYLFAHLHVPQSVLNALDSRHLDEVRSVIMSRLTDIPARYGGHVWTVKEDGCFFAFRADGHVPAILTALEMRAAVNIFNVTIENLPDPICISMGIDAGQTMYRENKSELYSEALNLSAHLAYHEPDHSRLTITAEVFDRLWPRARKYFFSAGTFEGRLVYHYETVA